MFIVCITCNFKWQSFSAAKHFAFVFFLMPITTIFLNLHVMDNLKHTHTHTHLGMSILTLAISIIPVKQLLFAVSPLKYVKGFDFGAVI